MIGIRCWRTGRLGPCGDYGEFIEKKLAAGLSTVRIHQDLQIDSGISGSYHSVWRFIQNLGKKASLPFRRMETEPGQEAQIDFGTAAYVIGANGKKRHPWMFRIVLSCSRKAYSEVVRRQTTDNFIAAIEDTFHYFGGALAPRPPASRQIAIQMTRPTIVDLRVRWIAGLEV
ncbi:MAG: hypothetical protein KDA91_11115 [Planctomycetaceae bacterium]|nr:hypothetical protein [Planctomycetaceae bacterium]